MGVRRDLVLEAHTGQVRCCGSRRRGACRRPAPHSPVSAALPALPLGPLLPVQRPSCSGRQRRRQPAAARCCSSGWLTLRGSCGGCPAVSWLVELAPWLAAPALADRGHNAPQAACAVGVCTAPRPLMGTYKLPAGGAGACQQGGMSFLAMLPGASHPHVCACCAAAPPRQRSKRPRRHEPGLMRSLWRSERVRARLGLT